MLMVSSNNLLCLRTVNDNCSFAGGAIGRYYMTREKVVPRVKAWLPRRREGIVHMRDAYRFAGQGQSSNVRIPIPRRHGGAGCQKRYRVVTTRRGRALRSEILPMGFRSMPINQGT